jgi:anion-transporting  ArsA/GET3 family ATPase
MVSPLDRSLLYVTGKGGVGKTTVAVALGLAAAARGRRTIVCEVAEQDQMSRVFEREGVGSEETELAPNLWAITIDPGRALEEWFGRMIGNRALMRVLLQSSAFQYFVAAAPGARELVTIGKIWDLAQLERWDRKAAAFDQVIVDAPASGHGLAMLRTPRTFADIARVGPIRRQADRIQELLTDPRRTAYLAVALAEEMPVNETLDLQTRLHETMGMRLDAVVVNAVYPRRFSATDRGALDAARTADRSTAARGALAAAVSEDHRVRVQQSQLRRLRRGAEGSVVTLPYLFQPALDLEALEGLARLLERRLG